MKKKIIFLQLIFTIIVGVTFYFGITVNPARNINDFCANLSSEFIGWILAVTIFQYYFDVKMAAKNKKQQDKNPSSVASEILKLKSLLDDGAITQSEFEKFKNRL